MRKAQILSSKKCRICRQEGINNGQRRSENMFVLSGFQNAE